MKLSPEEREKIQKIIHEDLKEGIRRRKEQYSENQDGKENEKTRLQQIAEVRRQVEEEFYSNNPDYVQYVNRYGITTWILRDELKLKQAKGRIRKYTKSLERFKQLRKFLLTSVFILSAYVGYLIYQKTTLPPVLKIETNALNGLIFIDNQITTIKPNTYHKIDPGKKRIGLAAPGFRTMFREIELNKKDTLVLQMYLEPDSTYDPDLAGLWRTKVPPPKPDEPLIITNIRNLSSKPSATILPKSISQPIEKSEGGLFITSNHSDAVIYINGVPTPYPQNTLIRNVPTGEMTIEVRKDGYLTKPSFVTFNYDNPKEVKSLAFELIPERSIKLKIKTEPVAGEIKVDGIVIGTGEIEIEPSMGMHTISFGDVIGFITPSPRTIEVSDRMTETVILAQYSPSIDVEFKLDETGKIRSKGIIQYNVGYWTQEQGAVPSNEYGPEIVKTKPFNFYVFQMGPGKPNANPSGNDYIEILFNLPVGIERGKSGSLIIEGYATNRNFQFNLTKLTEIAIYVNDQPIQMNFRPSVNIDETRSVARDVFPIGRFLKSGTNKILLRTTDYSKCYYLLKSLRIE
ncbi:MAG: PEGA domain-containing protein [bacterium]|nr:PEGA domain-containing protein [bacterium]